jgi:hypothetical protein
MLRIQRDTAVTEFFLLLSLSAVTESFRRALLFGVKQKTALETSTTRRALG